MAASLRSPRVRMSLSVTKIQSPLIAARPGRAAAGVIGGDAHHGIGDGGVQRTALLLFVGDGHGIGILCPSGR